MDILNTVHNIPISVNCNNFSHLPVRESVLMRICCLQYQLSESNNWKPVPGHEEYLINEVGAVKHLKSYGGKSRVLVATFRNNRYFYVTITKNGKRIGHPVDRLVASTFLDIPINNIKKIIHKDGIKFNNTISNLMCVLKDFS